MTTLIKTRWTTLGAFNPFYRNHNGDSSIPQEFFVWKTVTEAAKSAIDIRYRLLDYIYTAMHTQSKSGTPILNPLFFIYPSDSNTFSVDLQFFYGDAILVSPVTQENSTSVEIYLPDDLFYDFYTYAPIKGSGANHTLTDIEFTEIPLHIKSGSIIPMRNSSAYTTTEVRQKPFDILVAPNTKGKASGSLYLDDGESIEQEQTSEIKMEYKKQILSISGKFGYQGECSSISGVTILGVESAPKGVYWSKGKNGKEWVTCPDGGWAYDSEKKTVTVNISQKLDGEIKVKLQ